MIYLDRITLLLAADSFSLFFLLAAISSFCHECFFFYKHRHGGSPDLTLLSVPLNCSVEKSHLTDTDRDLPRLLSKHVRLAGCLLSVSLRGI